MLWEEIIETERQLDQALATFRLNGLEWVRAENNYQMEKSKQIMRLKAEGFPITLIPQMVKGLKSVAELNLIRMEKEVVYKANGEAIQVKKKELSVLQDQANREWSDAARQ